MTIHTLILVGCGKLGGAMLTRWCESGVAQHVHVVSPRHAESDADGLTWHRDFTTLPAGSEDTVIVFAVKPALLAELLPHYARRFGATPLYISVAAGKTLAFYTQHLGAKASVVRAMPNTPGTIGHGVTALCAPGLHPAARSTTENVMSALGHLLWIEDESSMNAVSAISGCGPAYVFLFIESLARAGIAAGLPESQARALAMNTATGSVAYASQSSQPLPALWQQVASPGGMTEAALNVLSAPGGMPDLLKKAVEAAITRAAELAKK